jgi:hypothetical protein
VKRQVLKFLVLISLGFTFYLFGGFEPPTVAPDDYRSPRGLNRAWLVTVLLFAAGAVLTLWGNAIAQTVALDTPDGVYPIIGFLLVIAGFTWMLMVRTSAAG